MNPYLDTTPRNGELPSGIRAKPLPCKSSPLELLVCGPREAPEATLERVAARFYVSVKQIKAQDRRGPLPHARAVASWLLRGRGLSYPAIGRILAKDHTTIMSAVKRVEREMARNPAFAAVLQELRDDGDGQDPERKPGIELVREIEKPTGGTCDAVHGDHTQNVTRCASLVNSPADGER